MNYHKAFIKYKPKDSYINHIIDNWIRIGAKDSDYIMYKAKLTLFFDNECSKIFDKKCRLLQFPAYIQLSLMDDFVADQHMYEFYDIGYEICKLLHHYWMIFKHKQSFNEYEHKIKNILDHIMVTLNILYVSDDVEYKNLCEELNSNIPNYNILMFYLMINDGSDMITVVYKRMYNSDRNLFLDCLCWILIYIDNIIPIDDSKIKFMQTLMINIPEYSQDILSKCILAKYEI